MPRAPLLALVAAALVSACGGGRAPQDVAREYVAGDDPAKCADADLAFLERQSGRRGDAARAACERAVEASEPPSDVRVVSRTVRGDRAEVRLEAATQDVRVTLVRRDGDWLVTGLG